MLWLDEIRELRTDPDTGHRTFRVTLDRNGRRMQYEFTWLAPRTPEHWPMVDYPLQVIWDLVDYDVEPPPGGPPGRGAYCIPPLSDITQAVNRAARGRRDDFPLLLDER